MSGVAGELALKLKELLFRMGELLGASDVGGKETLEYMVSK